MLHPVPMVHLRIQVANRDASAVTRRIAQEGLLHLVDLAHGRVAGDAAPPGSRELLAAYRDLVHRAERLAERLGVRLSEPSGEIEGRETRDLARESEALEATLAPLEESLSELWRRRAAVREGLAHARETLTRSHRVRATGFDLSRAMGLRFTCLRLGEAAMEDLTTLASLLSPAPFAVVPLEGGAGPSLLAAVAVPSGDRERLEKALRVVSFHEVAFPTDLAEWEPERLEAAIRKAEEEERQVSAELGERAAQAVSILGDVSGRAQVGALLLQAQTFFAAAGRFVVISGWVPEESAERMRAAILERTGGRAVVDIEKPEDLPEVASGALAVPILHRNPILLRPFQKLIQLYGTPSYEELEPTAFFAVSFLVMFGLMFGDVGHGAVLFLAGYCLFRWIPRYLDYGILLMEGGTAAALFGFLYGSFFGIEGALPVLWMDPLKDLPRFLSVAIAIGIALVSIGLVINVVNAWHAGERSLAVFGPRGLFGAFGYWVMAALAVRLALGGEAGLPAWGVVTLLVIPLLLLAFKGPIVRRLERGRPVRRSAGAGGPRILAALEGSVELVDSMVTFFANTISFLRIAAFALVHAGAFLALFALADTLSRVKGGGVLSVALLVAGNAVIILLEGLTVSVQVLRLEYYEFFGKFFRGGGEPYRPLMLRASAAKGVRP
jgi:V/A-type H+/Na+-transporting ATPase subunit I